MIIQMIMNLIIQIMRMKILQMNQQQRQQQQQRRLPPPLPPALVELRPQLRLMRR